MPIEITTASNYTLSGIRTALHIPHTITESLSAIYPVNGNNTASGQYDIIAGGVYNTTSLSSGGGCYNTISGGLRSTASGNYSTVGGGAHNYAVGQYSVVAGGGHNLASGSNSTITGGLSNTASGYHSTIINGICNNDNGYNTVFILGSNINATQANTTFANSLILLNGTCDCNNSPTYGCATAKIIYGAPGESGSSGSQPGAGGSINVSGGIADDFGGIGGNAGSINMSGGSGGNTSTGGNGGIISLGGARGNTPCAGGSAGSIISDGASFLDGYYANGGSLTMSAGYNRSGGSINTSAGGGSINTTGSGYIQFGYDTQRTTLAGTATSNRIVNLPDNDGTLALTPNPSIVATFQNSNQTLRLFTTEDYGATLTEIGEGTSLIGGTFLRDPSITYVNDNYYIAYTNGWESSKDIAAGRPASFSIIKSSDLANWTLQTTVSAPGNCVSVWSPCFFTDTDGSLHTIFSAATSLDGGGYANTNRFYYTRPVTNENLSTWTAPVQITLNGSPYVYNMFGAAVIKYDSTYYLFFISGPGGSLYRAYSPSISGPYTVDPDYPSTCGVPGIDGIVNINKLPNGRYRMFITTQNPYAAKIYDSANLTDSWFDTGWLGGDFNQNLYTANNTSGLNNSSMVILPLSAKTLLATKGIPVTYQAAATELANITKNPGSTSTVGSLYTANLPTLTVTLTGTLGTTSVAGNVTSSTGSYSLSTGMTLWFDGVTGDVNPSPYIGEFKITKTGTNSSGINAFTFNTNRPVAVAKPNGTLTAKNYWTTIFEGYGGASMAGLLTISVNAAGSRHRCVIAISTGSGNTDQPDIKVLTSSGYSFLSHVRVSTVGDNSGWIKIEIRPAGAAAYDMAISATYQSLMGQCVPGIKPLKWGSNGPLAYSTRKYADVGASNPRIINNFKMDMPAVNGGSYSYIYPGLLNNGTPDGPFNASYQSFYQLDNMPSYTFTAHYPGLPERLLIANLGQGGEGASWLTAQLYNPSGTITTATTVYGTLLINYGA